MDEETWLARVLEYVDPHDPAPDQEALIEFVRERFKAEVNEDTPEHEYDAWVDVLVASYYG